MKGFALPYTILFLSFITISIGIASEVVMRELTTARDEVESFKAFYAADAAIECAKFYQAEGGVFNPEKADTEYSCGIGNFRAGLSETGCINHTYTYEFQDFNNDSCVELTVRTAPRTVSIPPLPATTVCNIEIRANGKNTCDPNARTVVERTRWVNM